MNEEALLQKIKRDPSSFAELFKLYYQPIFGYVFRRTGDFDAAADIAAETFYKAFVNLSSFSYRGISIKIWLYRIATNEVNQHYRSRLRQCKFLERLDFDERPLFENYLQHDREALEKELAQHEQFLLISKALKTLPVKYQTVIALRYFEGKDNKEIAEILNIPEGTLKSLLSRGLEKLRIKCNRNEP